MQVPLITDGPKRLVLIGTRRYGGELGILRVFIMGAELGELEYASTRFAELLEKKPIVSRDERMVLGTVRHAKSLNEEDVNYSVGV